MLKIEYPEPQFKVRKENGQEWIFDIVRKKWIVLTEEEWVRQNFIQYLVQQCHIPLAFIALEKEIWLGELKKRFDILVYDHKHKPWMMVECKEPKITLDDKVLHQVLRYHAVIPVSILIITNGNHTYAWQKEKNELKQLNEIPLFSS